MYLGYWLLSTEFRSVMYVEARGQPQVSFLSNVPPQVLHQPHLLQPSPESSLTRLEHRPSEDTVGSQWVSANHWSLPSQY